MVLNLKDIIKDKDCFISDFNDLLKVFNDVSPQEKQSLAIK